VASQLYRLFGIAADLVFEEDTLEIIHQCRDGQHVFFSFYVPCSYDLFVKILRLVPDVSKIAGRE